MLEIGRTYDLEVIKRVDFGLYLDAQNLGSVLLPNRWVPEDIEPGDIVNVFLYHDSEDRLIATTQTPHACVGQVAFLKAIETTRFGAFLDWGLDKHLLLPFAEQRRKAEAGKSYLVYLYIDERDGRIVASAKIDKFIEDNTARFFKPREPVELIIANTTELGFKAVVNHSTWGILYKNEVFQKLSHGQKIQGYVKRVRPDGKIDLTLNGGDKTKEKNTGLIMKYLLKRGGYAPLHDKTDPKIISSELGMSKNAFKKALGSLYKNNSIVIEGDGIRIVEK